VPVRSDQIIFFRDRRDNEEPLAPGNATSYSNTTDASRVRMWYGHALRTAPDGTDPADPLLGIPPNELARNWVLGRQALFLANDPNNTHFQGAWYNAPLQPYGYASSSPVKQELYNGLHDVAEQRLHNATDSNNDFAVPGIVDQLMQGSQEYAWDTSGDGNDVHDYTFARQRLRVNPAPEGNNFRPWQVGQMHPYWAGHVSDFIVEFAADFENNSGPGGPDGEIDVDDDASGTDINGRNYEYDGGNIKWYTARDSDVNNIRTIENEPGTTQDDRQTTVYVNDPSDGNNYDSTKPPVYEVPGGLPNVVPPVAPPGLQKTYYNAQSGQGRQNNATASFLWVHDDDGSGGSGSDWPWLIRIRYRLHDPEGHVNDSEGNPGKWFEHIIQVQRPDP